MAYSFGANLRTNFGLLYKWNQTLTASTEVHHINDFSSCSGGTTDKATTSALSFAFLEEEGVERAAVPAEVMLSSRLHKDFICEPNQTQSSENSGEDSPPSAALASACSSNRGPLYL